MLSWSHCWYFLLRSTAVSLLVLTSLWQSLILCTPLRSDRHAQVKHSPAEFLLCIFCCPVLTKVLLSRSFLDILPHIFIWPCLAFVALVALRGFSVILFTERQLEVDYSIGCGGPKRIWLFRSRSEMSWSDSDSWTSLFRCWLSSEGKIL